MAQIENFLIELHTLQRFFQKCSVTERGIEWRCILKKGFHSTRSVPFIPFHSIRSVPLLGTEHFTFAKTAVDPVLKGIKVWCPGISFKSTLTVVPIFIPKWLPVDWKQINRIFGKLLYMKSATAFLIFALSHLKGLEVHDIFSKKLFFCIDLTKYFKRKLQKDQKNNNGKNNVISLKHEYFQNFNLFLFL
ncbi:hypothetical protein BpHYR1_016101 [Brachionus plicatilis]|uniref:Uncharacterized protein n=1 Tax=Brachionus plicatilis TaxID=10195 RepID=A0A3M7QSF6_BRAPC|nr:hypothetical protein BpHYR1_016101 [Brachionus plicatilis]